jgi:DNA-directed RNA polymerase beta' subunit
MRRNAEGKKPEHGRWTCPICGGQWGDPRLRRYQMGYIKLRRTVVHPWVLYSTPNYLALLMKVRRTDIQQLAWCNTVISRPFPAYNQSKSYLYSNSGRWSQNMASWDNFKITEFDTEK